MKKRDSFSSDIKVPFFSPWITREDKAVVMKALNSEGLPTFIIFKNGKETWRHQGLVSLEDFNNALK